MSKHISLITTYMSISIQCIYLYIYILRYYVIHLKKIQQKYLVYRITTVFQFLTIINQPSDIPMGPSSFSNALVGMTVLARLARRTAAPRAPKVIPAAAVPWVGNIQRNVDIREISTLKGWFFAGFCLSTRETPKLVEVGIFSHKLQFLEMSGRFEGCFLTQPVDGNMGVSPAISRCAKIPEVLLRTWLQSWWLNQPIWKICSSNWMLSPRIGVDI